MERLKEFLVPDDFYRLKIELKGYDIDWDKAINYLNTVNISNIRNKSAYYRAIVVRKVKEEGMFIKEISNDYEINQMLFFQFWADHSNINTDDEYSKFIFEQLVDYIVSSGCPLEEMHEITESITKRATDTKQCLAYLKLSKVIQKYNVRIPVLLEMANEQWTRWNELLESFNEVC